MPFPGNVKTNDTDVDSPTSSLAAIIVTNPSKGTVTLNANGSFTYTPKQTGLDSFTYKLQNILPSGFPNVPMSADSAPASVNFQVFQK